MLLRRLRDRYYFMIFVPIAKDAIDAEQFEVFLAERLDFLRRVKLTASKCLVVALSH